MVTHPLPDEDNYCRLARALIEKHGCSYAEAMDRLAQLCLHIICGAGITNSPALQAAVLTAVNTAKRSFLGGVTITLPADCPVRVPWPRHRTLAEVVTELGAIVVTECPTTSVPTVCIGHDGENPPGALSVWTSGWRGGVAPGDANLSLPGGTDLTLAGVMAGSFGVARAFLETSGLSTRFVEKPLGFSLWRPDLDAVDPASDGPTLEYLPQRLWFAGLGHLGQAYLWNLALLPYTEPANALFVLQDFDKVIPGNRSSGLLCDNDSPGVLKTRLASRWLEERGFQTRMIERAFDDTLRLQRDEPFIAYCGFDSASTRAALDRAPFHLVVDCGLGDSIETFDRIFLHTFPDASRRPSEIWSPQESAPTKPNGRLLNALDQGLPCGVLAETLARKALATSFVGAFAGAFALAEVIRGLHGGKRCEFIKPHLRSNAPLEAILLDEDYQCRVGLAGVLPARVA